MIRKLKYNLLLNKFKNIIYNYALYMVKNKMDADDITQEVFIRFWDNFDKVKSSSVKAWLMRATHNLCIDYLRKRKNQLNKNMQLNENTLAQNNIRISDPEINFRKNILKNKIVGAIKELPDNLKSVFVLYEMEGFKYKEISESLEIPLNSVKVYLLRARKKLQEDLKEFRYENE